MMGSIYEKVVEDCLRWLDALAGLVKIGRQHEETKTAAGVSTSLLDTSDAVLFQVNDFPAMEAAMDLPEKGKPALKAV